MFKYSLYILSILINTLNFHTLQVYFYPTYVTQNILNMLVLLYIISFLGLFLILGIIHYLYINIIYYILSALYQHQFYNSNTKSIQIVSYFKQNSPTRNNLTFLRTKIMAENATNAYISNHSSYIASDFPSMPLPDKPEFW